jgi:hypothetical protein
VCERDGKRPELVVFNTVARAHLMEYWVIPPKANAAFVAAMVDVLKVYTRPHNPARPLVCLDETSKQLVAETGTTLPARPGRPARYDHEDKRNGTASLYLPCAPSKVGEKSRSPSGARPLTTLRSSKQLSDVHCGPTTGAASSARLPPGSATAILTMSKLPGALQPPMAASI